MISRLRTVAWNTTDNAFGRSTVIGIWVREVSSVHGGSRDDFLDIAMSAHSGDATKQDSSEGERKFEHCRSLLLIFREEWIQRLLYLELDWGGEDFRPKEKQLNNGGVMFCWVEKCSDGPTRVDRDIYRKWFVKSLICTRSDLDFMKGWNELTSTTLILPSRLTRTSDHHRIKKPIRSLSYANTLAENERQKWVRKIIGANIGHHWNGNFWKCMK